MLTISKLKRWSINYYIDTAQAAEHACRIWRGRAAGWGSTTPNTKPAPRYGCWPATPTPSPRWSALTDAQRAGGDADAELVARWLDDGITPNGAHGRAFGERGVHGFDLTFCAPKSVSLVRALRTDDVVAKAIADAHTTALSEAMEYLAAHAGYTRVHNPHTGEKDLVRLPGLVAVAYQHETSRCGDPHLHTHVIVPNRQARADGQTRVDRWDVAVSRSQGGRGDLSGHPAPRTAPVAWGSSGRRSTRRPGWPSWPGWTATPSPRGRGAPPSCASGPPTTSTSSTGPLSAAQLAAAQKATRPAKPEELAWAQLLEQWRADARGLQLDRAAFDAARAARRAAARTPFDRARLADAAEKIEKAAFTRADLVEIVGAQLPVDTERTPRELVEAAVDEYRHPA